jgi:Fe-S-cluster containining protein
MPTADTILPCNGCTACCQLDAIGLHPEDGDDPQAYHTEPFPGSHLLRMLAHQPNGDCFYLDRTTGCTIWGRRPARCRTLDCRVFLSPKMRGSVPPAIITAAQALQSRTASTPVH